MPRRLFRWTFRAGVVAALVAAALELANRRRDDDRPGSPLFPATGDDMWPPVPTNPRRS